MTRGAQGDRLGGLVAGFEYTFYGLLGTSGDVSLLSEHLYDGRDLNPVEAPVTIFANDLFLGTRFTLNDTQNTELLLGAHRHLDTERVYSSSGGAAAWAMRGASRSKGACSPMSRAPISG